MRTNDDQQRADTREVQPKESGQFEPFHAGAQEHAGEQKLAGVAIACNINLSNLGENVRTTGCSTRIPRRDEGPRQCGNEEDNQYQADPSPDGSSAKSSTRRGL